MTFSFPEGSPAKILMEWFKKQEKEEFTIYDVLNADIEISEEKKRKAVWQLIDNDDLDLLSDLKIRVKRRKRK